MRTTRPSCKFVLTCIKLSSLQSSSSLSPSSSNEFVRWFKSKSFSSSLFLHALDGTCLCIEDHSSYKGSQASCTCKSICRKATLVQPEVLVVQPSSQCLGLGHHRIQCLGSNLFLLEGGCQDRLQDSVSIRRLDSLLSDSVFVGSLHKVAVD